MHETNYKALSGEIKKRFIRMWFMDNKDLFIFYT